MDQVKQKSHLLRFAELFVQSYYTESDWTNFSREVLNCSNTSMLQDKTFVAGLLFQVPRSTTPERISIINQLGALFYDYFWDELKGSFAAFAEERGRIKALLSALIAKRSS